MTINRKEAVKKWGEIIQEVENKKAELDNILGAARQTNEQLAGINNDANNKLGNLINAENQSNQKINNLDQIISTANQKENEIKSIYDAVDKLHQESNQKKTEIEDLKSKTEKLLEDNKDQSKRVSDILQKATAGSLSNSFNIRKGEHETSSKFWIKMIGISVFILVCLAGWIAWIAHEKGILSYEFFLKLSITFPIIYWLIFSTRQFTKSKRLEEEYAFKSAISLSLEAYRNLIKKESEEPTKESVVPFITEAVSKIFSSPSISISNHPHREDVDITEGILDRLIKLINSVKG